MGAMNTRLLPALPLLALAIDAAGTFAASVVLLRQARVPSVVA